MKNRYIVTHGGPAHRDDFLACCLLVADNGGLDIYRCDPTMEEMECRAVLVVDVGNSASLQKNNFDHHQMDRNAPATCALTLVCEYLAIDSSFARQVWPWFEFTEVLDSKGPVAAARLLGAEPDQMIKTLSPIEEAVLRLFSGYGYISRSDPLHELMCAIGQSYLDYIDRVAVRLDQLKDEAEFIELRGVRICDVTHIARHEEPLLGLEIFLRGDAVFAETAVTVMQDDRGDGLTLFRRNDHPRVDFSRLEGRDDIVFAHKGGFIAKTVEGAVWPPLVTSAIKE